MDVNEVMAEEERLQEEYEKQEKWEQRINFVKAVFSRSNLFFAGFLTGLVITAVFMGKITINVN